jgi:SnoaL-like domain
MVSCLKVPSATLAAYAPDAILLTPLSPPVRGAEAIRRHDDGIRSAFPGARLTISRPVVRGQHTAVEWEYRGTNEGPIVLPAGVMPATNRAVSLRGASFLRFTSDGLIAEEHRYFDVCSLLEQLAVA